MTAPVLPHGRAGAACQGPLWPTRPKLHHEGRLYKLEMNHGWTWCDDVQDDGIRMGYMSWRWSPRRGLNMVEEPEFFDINVTLDSGAAEHVADIDDAPAIR